MVVQQKHSTQTTIVAMTQVTGVRRKYLNIQSVPHRKQRVHLPSNRSSSIRSEDCE